METLVSTPRAGSFVWYQLATRDPRAASRFYRRVLGWEIDAIGVSGMRYFGARVGRQAVAGITDFGAAATPAWSGYILVDDPDDMVARIVGAGGTVHQPPMNIEGVGRFAVAADPQGARFTIFRDSITPSPGLSASTPGAIAWHELNARDSESAFEFYQSLFGWEPAYAHDMGPDGTYQTFSIGDTWAGGMMSSAATVTPYWRYYFTVDDIDAGAARIRSAGGRVERGPHEVPGGTWVVLATDPQGAPFAISGPRD